jgi:hypothetical protein
VHLSVNPTPIFDRRSCALALALTLSALLPVAGQDNPSAESDHSLAIRGTVINAVTHEPINRAVVSSSDNRFATFTDSEGHFEFTMPNPEGNGDTLSTSMRVGSLSGREYSVIIGSVASLLTARKPGFLQDQNANANANIDPSTHELVIALTPEALITGRVTLPSADPAERITVELYRRTIQEGRAQWVPAGTKQTRSTGEFRFAELAAGIYKVFTRELADRDPETVNPREQFYAYPPVYFPAANDFASAAPIELTPGKNFQADLSVARQPYYPVKVPVANLPPGSFVNVDVSLEGHRGPGFSLGFNPRGQFITGSLPTGTYTVDAVSVGNPPAFGTVSISVKGAALDGPRMTMVPASSIRLNVKEDFTAVEHTSGENLAGVSSVEVQDPGAPSNPRPLTPRDYLNLQLRPAEDFTQDRGTVLRPPTGPDDDSLWLDNILPGRYWVQVHTLRGYVAGILSGTVDLLRNPLVVGQGASVPPLEITVRNDGGRIEGTIEDANPSSNAGDEASPRSSLVAGIGAPAGYVYCIPLPDSAGQFMEFPASSDGNFNSPELPPGGYRVLAFKQPNQELEYRNPEAMRAYESEGVLVRLAPAGKETVRLHLISRSD